MVRYDGQLQRILVTVMPRRSRAPPLSCPLGTEAQTYVSLPNGGEGNVSRTSKPAVKAVSDDEVRALLARYGCPVPFHAVRTRFLGNIASPVISAAPLDTVKGLWGGELPEFDSLDAVNELLAVLIMGLWNRLARHQERSAPFSSKINGLQVAQFRRSRDYGRTGVKLRPFIEGYRCSHSFRARQPARLAYARCYAG